MKIGAHVEIPGAGLPYRQAFPLLKKLGAQGVELVMKEGGLLSLDSRDADFLKVRQLAREEGLAISGLTNGYSWTLPMTSARESTRRAGEDAMKRALEGAALLGADSLLIVPGYARTEFVTPSEVHPVPVALERARAGVERAAQYAGEVGVSLNVEVVWGGMLRTPEEMRRFFEEVDSPFLGLYLDTGNVYPECGPVEWIHAMGGAIRRVHVKDYLPGRPGLEAFCSLGKGQVDFRAAVQALKNAGYDGWLGAEHHIAKNVPEAAHTLDFLRNLAAG
ncbi:MAG: sugar phosphate isomerase/epimerase family protein [Candidatus Limiplasma sp.]|nr:sugar phosphate isomerase/epimerase family protein [Candidatus Limiplasma sp.]